MPLEGQLKTVFAMSRLHDAIVIVSLGGDRPRLEKPAELYAGVFSTDPIWGFVEMLKLFEQTNTVMGIIHLKRKNREIPIHQGQLFVACHGQYHITFGRASMANTCYNKGAFSFIVDPRVLKIGGWILEKQNKAVEALKKYENQAPEEICTSRLGEWKAFMGDNDPFGDIAMVCVD